MASTTVFMNAVACDLVGNLDAREILLSHLSHLFDVRNLRGNNGKKIFFNMDVLPLVRTLEMVRR